MCQRISFVIFASRRELEYSNSSMINVYIPNSDQCSPVMIFSYDCWFLLFIGLLLTQLSYSSQHSFPQHYLLPMTVLSNLENRNINFFMPNLLALLTMASLLLALIHSLINPKHSSLSKFHSISSRKKKNC